MKNNKRLEEVINAALSTQIATHVILMLGTAFAVNQAIFKMMLERGLSDKAASIGSVALAILAAKAIDGGLKQLLPYWIASIVGEKDKKTGVERLRWFNWVVAILTLSMLGASTYTNIALTPDIADKAVGEVNTSQYTAMADGARSRYESDLARFDEDVEEARKSLAEATANKDKAIDVAMKSQGGEMYRLAKGGNSWASGKLAGAVRSAERQANKAITAAQSTLEQAKQKRAAYIASSGANLDSVQLASTSLTLSAENNNQMKKGRFTGILFWIMIASLVGFICATIVVVTAEERGGYDTSQRATLGNVINGVGNKAKTGTISRLVKWFGLNRIAQGGGR